MPFVWCHVEAPSFNQADRPRHASIRVHSTRVGFRHAAVRVACLYSNNTGAATLLSCPCTFPRRNGRRRVNFSTQDLTTAGRLFRSRHFAGTNLTDTDRLRRAAMRVVCAYCNTAVVILLSCCSHLLVYQNGRRVD